MGWYAKTWIMVACALFWGGLQACPTPPETPDGVEMFDGSGADGSEMISPEQAVNDGSGVETVAETAIDAAVERGSETPMETGGDKGPTSLACNGALELCERRYDEVSYATTHNAMSSRDENWAFPNQNKKLSTQLQDGIRAVMLDVHEESGQATFCHGSNSNFCTLGKRPLKDALQDIKSFLDQNPRDIVTIIFENYVSASMLEVAFQESKALDLTYAHTKGATWPTLNAMIVQNKRLVVFTDNEGGKFPWLMKVWDHAWETHYSAKTPDDLKCTINRGSKDNPLFILNHLLTNPLASESLAREVNFNPFFLTRAQDCQKQSGRLPNFVTVDFYSIGDLFQVVKTLNKL